MEADESFLVLDTLMSNAYDRWRTNGDWTKEDFFDQLSDHERIAVCFGNLNQQVGNGGFMQWADNGYYRPETMDVLRDTLAAIKERSSAADPLSALLDLAENVFAEHDWDFERRLFGDDYDDESAWDIPSAALDKLDTLYYALGDAPLAMIDRHLAELGAAHVVDGPKP